MKEELEYQEIAVDTYYRPMHVPYFFYQYFIDTFMIPSFTCDNVTANLTYTELDPVYSCYCNNDDYHSLPTVNFELVEYNVQYDLDAADYLLLPYINYTRPLSLCVFAVARQEQITQQGDAPVITLGQRFLAKFPLMAVYDRANSTGIMAIGGGTGGSGGDEFELQIVLSVVIITVLFLLLVYLIYLRRNRIKAEEWLEVHKDVLFGSTWGKMTEVEILEALVKNKNMADTLASPQAQQDAAAAARGVPDHTWLSGSDEKSDDESGSDGDDGDKQDKELLTGNLKKGDRERDD